MTEMGPAGWYKQPGDRDERYWDGSAWTDQYRPASQLPPKLEDRVAGADAPGSGTVVPKAAKPTPGKRSGLGCLVLVVIAMLVFAVSKGCGGGSASSGGAALVNCRNAVKAQIKNPATADFELLSTTITDAQISGSVTAENDFGARKSLTYVCRISGDSVLSANVSQQ